MEEFRRTRDCSGKLLYGSAGCQEIHGSGHPTRIGRPVQVLIVQSLHDTPLVFWARFDDACELSRCEEALVETVGGSRQTCGIDLTSQEVSVNLFRESPVRSRIHLLIVLCGSDDLRNNLVCRRAMLQ